MLNLLIIIGSYVVCVVCLESYIVCVRYNHLRAAGLYAIVSVGCALLAGFITLTALGWLVIAAGFVVFPVGSFIGLWLIGAYGGAGVRALRWGRWRQRFAVLLSIPLVLLTVYAPVVGGYGISITCDWLNYNRAIPLLQAVERYREANNTFPHDLKALIPDYVSEIPHGVCGWGDALWEFDPFLLRECPTQETLLMVVTSNRAGGYALQLCHWELVTYHILGRVV